MQYEIYLSSKETSQKDFIVFIDDKPVKRNKNNEYILNCDKGYHNIKIQQHKIINSRYHFIIYPICLVLTLISGDSDFDGKTPCYAVYEAEVYLDKNIEIKVELYDVNREMKKSKQGFSYKIDVGFTKEIDVKVIKNECTATKDEKRRWFLYFVTLWTISFMFLTSIFTFVSIDSFKKGVGVMVTILFGLLACLSIIGWVFFIRRYYRWSR